MIAQVTPVQPHTSTPEFAVQPVSAGHAAASPEALKQSSTSLSCVSDSARMGHAQLSWTGQLVLLVQTLLRISTKALTLLLQ
jgi:hypothetical protein